MQARAALLGMNMRPSRPRVDPTVPVGYGVECEPSQRQRLGSAEGRRCSGVVVLLVRKAKLVRRTLAA